MSNKSRNNSEQNDVATDETIVVDGGESNNNEADIKDDVAQLLVDHFTNILLFGKGLKISPKTENHVIYEIASMMKISNYIFGLLVIKAACIPKSGYYCNLELKYWMNNQLIQSHDLKA